MAAENGALSLTAPTTSRTDSRPESRACSPGTQQLRHGWDGLNSCTWLCGSVDFACHTNSGNAKREAPLEASLASDPHSHFFKI
eukprot:1051822-Amphidinium_carterae.1